jgi:hypothetical protein
MSATTGGASRRVGKSERVQCEVGDRSTPLGVAELSIVVVVARWIVFEQRKLVVFQPKEN